MRLANIGNSTYISLLDEYNHVKNEIIFIVAKTGWGKGLTAEAILEEFYEQGYLVISIADPKDEIELGFPMFELKEEYEYDAYLIKHCNGVGKKMQSRPVKVYHPFTTHLPETKLPDMNIY